MTRSRLSTVQLGHLLTQLPARYLSVVAHLCRVRLLSGTQLDRLLADGNSVTSAISRARSRMMTFLTHHGLVSTLERRIGGIEAGSAGHLYVPTVAGYRLAALCEPGAAHRPVRHSATPGVLFLVHTLAVSELYVQLRDKSRSTNVRLSRFDTEPDSWWRHGNSAPLRPDAYAVLASATHADCWWIEVDNATESLIRIAQKIRTYRDHYATGGTGPNDVPPRVLFTAPNEQRAIALGTTIERHGGTDLGFIAVATQEKASDLMISELYTT